MCFSAQASFTASAVLAAIGILSLRANTSDRWFLFSLTPLLFSIQQFSEGVLWIALENGGFPLLQSAATYTFLLFAIVGWPAYMTLALYRIESRGFRKKLLKWCLAAATVWGITSVAYLVTFSQSAYIEGGNIVYSAVAPIGGEMLYAVIYAFLAIMPFFLTHKRKMWVLGSMIALSGALTMVWVNALISVWCFFAAIISSYVYYIVRVEV
ncbi:MAG: DUF6629 family protein [Candidatus Nanohaloarchaea archaeon]|nr:DUF6629 family protein [Candidatus Nanohaloarchaea archaeon]